MYYNTNNNVLFFNNTELNTNEGTTKNWTLNKIQVDIPNVNKTGFK